MAAPTRCKTKRSRLCSIRAKWTAARSTWSPANCSARLMPNVLSQLFGSAIWSDPRLIVSEALFAVARYQIEDASFHPYTSKFDFWLEGKARFTESEARGYALFNDPAKANCAGCHADQPTRDGLPPLFTDHQFEALGAPRNACACRQRRSWLFRSRHLRTLSPRHGDRYPILRTVHDADVCATP